MIKISPEENGSIDFFWKNNSNRFGYAYREVDGFYHFVNGHGDGGAWTAHSLRCIASTLDELNKEYEQHLAETFHEIPTVDSEQHF